MIFLRVFLAADGTPAAVLHSDRPVMEAGILQPNGEPMPFEDLGIAEPAQWKCLEGKPVAPSMHFYLRVEKHPHADSHPDAPKVRIKPEHAADCPAIHFCPAGQKEIIEHLAARPQDGLPPIARDLVKGFWRHRDDIDLATLRGLGMTPAEIRKLPRIERAQRRLAESSAAAAAAQAEQDAIAARQAKWAAKAALKAKPKDSDGQPL